MPASSFASRIQALAAEADAVIQRQEAKIAALEAELAQAGEKGNKVMRWADEVRKSAKSHIDNIQGLLAKDPLA